MYQMKSLFQLLKLKFKGQRVPLFFIRFLLGSYSVPTWFLFGSYSVPIWILLGSYIVSIFSVPTLFLLGSY
jgi:hypothetical protein